MKPMSKSQPLKNRFHGDLLSIGCKRQQKATNIFRL